jgi:hypothetical protein
LSIYVSSFVFPIHTIKNCKMKQSWEDHMRVSEKKLCAKEKLNPFFVHKKV